MSEPSVPLKQYLHGSLERGGRERLWEAFRQRQQPRAAWKTLALAAASLAACVLAFSLLWQSPRANAALLLVNGKPPLVLSASDRQSVFEFADGSRVTLGARTAVRVLENVSGRFVTRLEHGKGAFSVHPGGPRRWLIQCGNVAVEVVGTEFTIERSPAQTVVSVAHGVVLVRSDLLPNHERRLVAGERVLVAREPNVRAAPRDAAKSASSDSVSAVPVPSAPVVGMSSSQRGVSESAPARPSVEGTSGASQDAVDTLLNEADAARNRGDTQTAVRALNEALTRAGSNDPRRSIIALTLARLQMRRAPDQAAKTLSESSSAAGAAILEEDAQARLVEAYARAGRRAEAARAAAEYDRRFPSGRRAEEVHQWLRK